MKRINFKPYDASWVGKKVTNPHYLEFFPDAYVKIVWVGECGFVGREVISGMDIERHWGFSQFDWMEFNEINSKNLEKWSTMPCNCQSRFFDWRLCSHGTWVL